MEKKIDFKNLASLKFFTKLKLTLNRAKSNKICQIDSPWDIKLHAHVRFYLSHSKVHEMKPSFRGSV